MNRRAFLRHLSLVLAAGTAAAVVGPVAARAEAVTAPQTGPAGPATQQEIPHRLAYLSQPRTGMATVVCGDTVLFAGGATGGSPSGTVDLFDAASRTWTTAALSEPRIQPQAIVVGDCLVIAGGTDRDGKRSLAVDIYDTRNGAWSTAWLSAPLEGDPSLHPNTAVVGRRLLAIHQDVVDLFDADSGEWWSQPLSEPRSEIGIAVVGQTVMLAGGSLNAHDVSDAVDIYDAPTNTWSVAQLSLARTAVSTGVVGSTVLFASGVTGGKDANFGLGNVSGVLDIYDAATGQWSATQLNGSFPTSSIMSDWNHFRVTTLGSIAAIYGDRSAFQLFDTADGSWQTVRLPKGWETQNVRIVGTRLVMVVGRYWWTPGAICTYDVTTGALMVTALYPERRPAVPLGDDFDWEGITLSDPAREYGWVRVVGTKLVMGGGEWEPASRQGQPYNAASGVDIYDLATDTWTSLDPGSGSLGRVGLSRRSTVLTGTALSLDALDVESGAVTSQPLAEPQVGQATVATGKYLLVAGGSTQGAPREPWREPDLFTERLMPPLPGVTDAVYLFDMVDGAWSRAALSEPRRGLTAATIGNVALFIGGADVASGASDMVDLYDVKTGAWQVEHLADPQSRAQIQQVKIGDRGVGFLSYARPSRFGEHLFTGPPRGISTFDGVSRRWWTPALAQPRIGLTLASVGSQVLAIGGREPESKIPTDLVDLFDLADNTTRIAKLSEPRARPIVGTVGSKLYIVDRYGSTTVDIYDADSGQWTTTELPAPLGPPPNDLYALPSAAVVGGRIIFAAGGQSYQQQTVKAPVAILDTATGTWSMAEVPFRGARSPIVVGQKVLYVADGEDARDGSYDIQVYDAGSGAWGSTSSNLTSFRRDDLIAVVADRWCLLLQTSFSPIASRVVVHVYDATASRWTSGSLPPELMAGDYGSVVLRPAPITQWSGDRPKPAPIGILDLSTGARQPLDLVRQREGTAIVWAGDRVLVAGGSVTSQSAMVDVFDVSGRRSAAP